MGQKMELITKVDIELPNGQTRQMIITKDKNGQLKHVKDDKGTLFHQADADVIKITHESSDDQGNAGHFRSAVMSVRDGTLLVTQHNPTCGWYFIGGKWYWLCW